MIDATDVTFADVAIERSKTVPVVVDLWAEWCGPCKTLGPILERVVAETDGAVELVKVDVDANPQVANAFRAQSIPAVHALADGKVVDSFIGALPEEPGPRLRPSPAAAAVRGGRAVARGDDLVALRRHASSSRAARTSPSRSRHALVAQGLRRRRTCAAREVP